MHHDESLHALYSWYIASSDGFFGSGYKHDPMMHGPLQIELTALIFRLFDMTIFRGDQLSIFLRQSVIETCGEKSAIISVIGIFDDILASIQYSTLL